MLKCVFVGLVLVLLNKVIEHVLYHLTLAGARTSPDQNIFMIELVDTVHSQETQGLLRGHQGLDGIILDSSVFNRLITIYKLGVEARVVVLFVGLHQRAI